MFGFGKKRPDAAPAARPPAMETQEAPRAEPEMERVREQERGRDEAAEGAAKEKHTKEINDLALTYAVRNGDLKRNAEDREFVLQAISDLTAGKSLNVFDVQRKLRSAGPQYGEPVMDYLKREIKSLEAGSAALQDQKHAIRQELHRLGDARPWHELDALEADFNPNSSAYSLKRHESTEKAA